MTTIVRESLVSVVIPTYNRLAQLHQVLCGLAEQIVPALNMEVVVVSDGCSDGTDEYLSSGRTPVPVRHARQSNQGPAAARNHGVSIASGALLVFLDDDVVPLPELVAEHLQAHEREGPSVVVLGPMMTPPGFGMTSWVRYEQAMLYKQYRAMIHGLWQPTARQFYTGNASLLRRHVVEAGGFCESFQRAEDVEFAFRLADRGLDFVFVPTAAGHHYAERSYASWRRNAYVYGRNDAILARDKGRNWIFDVVPREFMNHHPGVRWMVRRVVNRPRSRNAAFRLLECLLAIDAVARTEVVAKGILSAIYNTSYYQGFEDEAPGMLHNALGISERQRRGMPSFHA